MAALVRRLAAGVVASTFAAAGDVKEGGQP
jgi:hypothetical protein